MKRKDRPKLRRKKDKKVKVSNLLNVYDREGWGHFCLILVEKNMKINVVEPPKQITDLHSVFLQGKLRLRVRLSSDQWLYCCRAQVRVQGGRLQPDWVSRGARSGLRHQQLQSGGRHQERSRKMQRLALHCFFPAGFFKTIFFRGSPGDYSGDLQTVHTRQGETDYKDFWDWRPQSEESLLHYGW